MVFVDPDTSTQNLYNQLVTVQQRAVDQIKIGGALGNVDQFCREQFAQLGLLNYPHSTGHGVGLEVHEAPRVSAASSDVAAAGQALTIEPGLYFPGRFGMRLEDTVLVTQNRVERLTRLSRSLTVVGGG